MLAVGRRSVKSGGYRIFLGRIPVAGRRLPDAIMVFGQYLNDDWIMSEPTQPSARARNASAAPLQPRLTRGRIAIRPSSPADCEFVIDVESHPENATFVGQWPPERHMACMSSTDSLHWIIEADGRRIGYVVLEGADDPNRSLLLRRIAIAGKGRGHGSAALRLVERYCFEVLGFHRLWLYVATDNRRAYRWYLKHGFVEEGVARDCDRRGDEYRSMYILSMLEDEYREGRKVQGDRRKEPKRSRPA